MTENISFEKAFERLEQILENMNEGKISLDSSLKLFEEADSLIKKCDSSLTSAQQKVDILIKERSKDLVLNKDREPKTSEFDPSSNILDTSNENAY